MPLLWQEYPNTIQIFFNTALSGTSSLKIKLVKTGKNGALLLKKTVYRLFNIKMDYFNHMLQSFFYLENYKIPLILSPSLVHFMDHWSYGRKSCSKNFEMPFFSRYQIFLPCGNSNMSKTSTIFFSNFFFKKFCR